MRYLVLILPALFFLSMSGCDKEYEVNLQGTWDLMSKPNEEVTYKWSFFNGKAYIMATDADENGGLTGELDTCARGNYILKNGVLTIAAPEYPCRSSIYTGDWDIEKLDKDFMTIRRESNNGTVWYEFQKDTE